MKILLLIMFALIFEACGVRGDPIPPGTPAEIGKGRKAFLEKKGFYKEDAEDLSKSILLDDMNSNEEKKKK